jgi:hypothetical protein
MDNYDEDLFYRLASPTVDCLWGYSFPLLLDERVDSLICKDNIYVIKFI